MAAISGSMSVNAQTNESQIERIKATDSHIKRTDMEGSSPVTSVTAQDIANDGLKLSAKVGDTADGGGKESTASLLFGSNSDKASHTYVVDYVDREEILGADRFYASSANQSDVVNIIRTNQLRDHT